MTFFDSSTKIEITFTTETNKIIVDENRIN
jgi:hypothetical protein